MEQDKKHDIALIDDASLLIGNSSNLNIINADAVMQAFP